jgi:hypothetical protein
MTIENHNRTFNNHHLATNAAASDREIAIFDARVDDLDLLLNGLRPGIEAIVLHPEEDGLNQISAILAARRGIKTLHIISHGAPGQLFLGHSAIGLNDLKADNVECWQKSFTDGADILLYGCNVAANLRGHQFVEQLAQLTGAAVAASKTNVGNPQKGANWELEATANSTFPIQAAVAFNKTTLQVYTGTFPLPGERSHVEGTGTTPEVYLGGNYIELGIDNDGTFGGDTVPTDFFGRQNGSGIGIVSDTDGFHIGTDLRIDYFLPGIQKERFVSGYKIAGTETTNLEPKIGVTKLQTEN